MLVEWRGQMVELPNEKYCPMCEKDRPGSAFKPRQRGNKVSWMSYCIECMKEYQHKNFIKRHTENRQYFVDLSRKWHYANLERKKEYYKQWTAANREYVNERMQRYRRKYPERIRAVAVRRRILGKAAIADKQKRARRHAAPGKFTQQEWLDLCSRFDHRCLACGQQEPTIKLTADHIIPITRGGSNWISNIQPLCGSCNSSKRVKSTDYREAYYEGELSWQ